MRSIGFALAVALCAVQLTVALPRPDYGISLEVFSSDKTGAVASEVSNLVADLYNDDPVPLTSNYATLSTVLAEVSSIGDDFSSSVLSLFASIANLAAANGDVSGAFGDVSDKIDALEAYITSGVSSHYDSLDSALEDNQIVLMLEDAFGEVGYALSGLSSVLEDLRADILTVSQSNVINKAVLRSILSPSVTTEVTISVEALQATLPLVFYILMTTKKLLAMADAYINELGDAASNAVDYIDEGLSALVTEVEGYAQGTSSFSTIVTDVATPNLDFTGLDMSSIPYVQTEALSFASTYGSDFSAAVDAVAGHYNDYAAAIPGVSDGYDTFYSNEACDHIYALVTVLINFGPYAEYCFEKYGEDALTLFDINARYANECVDIEITRLLQLQDVLVYIAETLVFSIEDLFDTVEQCEENGAACNDSDIDVFLGNLNTAIQDAHLVVLENIVDSETDAGLARLEACFTATKYSMLPMIDDLIDDIYTCEENGPNHAIFNL